VKNPFKNLWKHSYLRFYILNTLWNYNFWLNCQKLYKPIVYYEEVGEYTQDEFGKMVRQKTIKKAKRFVGYMYKNILYLDNPGMPIKDRDTWSAWKKKNLIK